MTLKEAIKSSLTILKQVMEEKLNATNIEVCPTLILDVRRLYLSISNQISCVIWT